jgi:phytoene dehydrogenase-like protein
MFIIVGAGLAGLTCAKVLAQMGRDVLVLEAGDGIGGRVQSDQRDGFTLDRGFQVLFTAYPAVQRHLDLPALQPQAFLPGAAIAHEGKLFDLTDPLRDRNPAHVAAAIANPLLTLNDKMRILALRNDAVKRSVRAIFSDGPQNDTSIEADLLARGFSPRGAIDHFLRPFFGGITLNRDLHTSARFFQFVYKMLAEGDIVVPSAGIGAITRQLAAHLPPGAIQTRKQVVEILTHEGRAVGVRLTDGTSLAAEAVVLATPAPEAARLADLTFDPAIQPVQATCAYFASATSLYEGAKLVLHAAPDAVVNNVTQLTNIAPSYAPAGQHLISAVLLGNQPEDDEELTERARADLARIFPRAAVAELRPLAVCRIPLAQFDQPPGIFARLPKNRTTTPGLVLAGEYTESSSIHGAMHSGEKAAKVVLEG